MSKPCSILTPAETVAPMQKRNDGIELFGCLSHCIWQEKEATMKPTAKVKMVGLVLALALCYFIPATVSAETNVVTGVAAQSGGAGAAARLDFQITIPSFIVFRVGTAGGTIDTIQFNPSAADVAAGTAGIAGIGGDVGGGVVTVALISNGGGVTITETNNSGGNGLGNGGGAFISYGQINTADSGAGGIAPPALSDSNNNTSAIAPTAGSITNRTSTWTYTYDNPATPPVAGTYGGAANGGRVTYTAAIP